MFPDDEGTVYVQNDVYKIDQFARLLYLIMDYRKRPKSTRRQCGRADIMESETCALYMPVELHMISSS
jgi:hypothetical protein